MKSKKNSSFLSFITVLSVLGVGLGVTAMIVVLSVMDGFENELRKRLFASELHVLITPTHQTPGYRKRQVPEGVLPEAKIRAILDEEGVKGLKSVSSVLVTEAMFRMGSRVAGVVVKGVDAPRLSRITEQLVEKAETPMLSRPDGAGGAIRYPGIYVGRELAYELKLIPGDLITMISPTETEGPMNAIPRAKRYAVEGIYSSGLPEQELHTVYAAKESVRAFLKSPDVTGQWELNLENMDDAPAVARALRPSLPQFKVQDWGELNSHLFASLRLERISMFVILAFIVVVASFNIVTTLTLMVLEKKKEIAILKTMGAKHAEVGAVFLAEGLYIGGGGILGGTLLGFVICVLLGRYSFIELPDIYYDRNLPVTFRPEYYLVVGVVAFLIVLWACLYPARRAARLHPLEAIRRG